MADQENFREPCDAVQHHHIAYQCLAGYQASVGNSSQYENAITVIRIITKSARSAAGY